MAVKFGGRFPLGSVLVLIARDANGLEETKRLVEAVSPVVTIKTVPMDLGTQSEAVFDKLLRRIFTETGTEACTLDQGLIVHNAASLGPIQKLFTEIDQWSEVSRYFELNVVSFAIWDGETVYWPHGKPGLIALIGPLRPYCSQSPLILLRCVTEIKFAQNLR